MAADGDSVTLGPAGTSRFAFVRFLRVAVQVNQAIAGN
jgi:hypothetical protein